MISQPSGAAIGPSPIRAVASASPPAAASQLLIKGGSARRSVFGRRGNGRCASHELCLILEYSTMSNITIFEVGLEIWGRVQQFSHQQSSSLSASPILLRKRGLPSLKRIIFKIHLRDKPVLLASHLEVDVCRPLPVGCSRIGGGLLIVFEAILAFRVRGQGRAAAPAKFRVEPAPDWGRWDARSAQKAFACHTSIFGVANRLSR